MENIPLWLCIPFAGLLLCIAIFPLIKEEWWTDTTIRTDENGFAVAEGFKGDYRLIHGNTEAELKLTAGLQKQEITLA